jgi:hypothetical protein
MYARVTVRPPKKESVNHHVQPPVHASTTLVLVGWSKYHRTRKGLTMLLKLARREEKSDIVGWLDFAVK